MSDEKEHVIPVGDSSPIFPDLTGTYAPFRHVIDWSDPHSQRFLSLIERIATALESRNPPAEEQAKHTEQETILRALVSQAYHARDVNQMHWLIMQIARQLDIPVEGAENGPAS